MSINNAVSIPQAEDLTTVILATKMWNDELLGEVHQAELSRVTEKDGSVYWEVNHSIKCEDGHSEEGHDEFDNLLDAVEFYGDLAQITIYGEGA